MNDEEECAELLVDSGKWNDIACIGSGDSGARGYVCKTPKSRFFASHIKSHWDRVGGGGGGG